MIPYATTTISVLRLPASDDPRDPYDPEPAREVIASGVRAHISTGTGREDTEGGSQEVVNFRLSCDPTDIDHLDQVKDETTGDIYEVTWARSRFGVGGLDHTQAALKQVEGIAAGGRRGRR